MFEGDFIDFLDFKNKPEEKFLDSLIEIARWDFDFLQKILHQHKQNKSDAWGLVENVRLS